MGGRKSIHDPMIMAMLCGGGRMLEDDFAGSPEIIDEELINKSFGFLFLVRAAQLTAPIQ